jgi:hypothetical protein
MMVRIMLNYKPIEDAGLESSGFTEVYKAMELLWKF